MEKVVLGCKKNDHFDTQVPSNRDERIVMAMTQALLKMIHVVSQSHFPLKKLVFEMGCLGC